ncbi:UNVERIFIED_CONTAM: protein NO VEIN [Sesamum angustifolium]|uniref:Protein NO VEIN n=1 Tax=Sesamum angustifolium TaxID=2727405 RepID=A0AAW2LVY4_9LAMI
MSAFIVTREAIYYGPADCSFVFSLVSWVLPYAQRYIRNAQPNKYFQLKQSGFEKLRRLKIVVVEKLFYRNVVKKCEITSKKRHECNCLLQDNILYCSRDSDPHSIFLEFSCLLYNETPELHFANFLHMITTMAESGATEDQIEFFILNSQKVPQLPAEESNWSLQSFSASMENDGTQLENGLAVKVEEQNSAMFKKRSGTNSNWPPVDWKTAPGFNSVGAFGSRKSGGSNTAEKILGQTDISTIEINGEFNIEVDPSAITQGVVSVEEEISQSQSNLSRNLVASSMNVVLDSVDFVAPDSKIVVPSNCSDRDEDFAQQALLTGRLGELVAFKYFQGKVGEVFVKWVNEINETGLPYDITLGGDEDSREYIEVKATKSARKNWFLISMREWQFAVEKGESFSVAHVVLADNNMARITIYKNPARLCQLGNLNLFTLLVMPKKLFFRHNHPASRSSGSDVRGFLWDELVVLHMRILIHTGVGPPCSWAEVCPICLMAGDEMVLHGVNDDVRIVASIPESRFLPKVKAFQTKHLGALASTVSRLGAQAHFMAIHL